MAKQSRHSQPHRRPRDLRCRSCSCRRLLSPRYPPLPLLRRLCHGCFCFEPRASDCFTWAAPSQDTVASSASTATSPGQPSKSTQGTKATMAGTPVSPRTHAKLALASMPPAPLLCHPLCESDAGLNFLAGHGKMAMAIVRHGGRERVPPDGGVVKGKPRCSLLLVAQLMEAPQASVMRTVLHPVRRRPRLGT
jgi:hypothetical protein